MNSVDLVLAFLLGVSALRGYWRGFFRESFGLLAVLGGAAAALQYSAWGTAIMEAYLRLPPPLPAGLTFVALFVVVYALVNFTGFALDRLAAASMPHSLNGVAGAVLGAGKAATMLAFILLFVHLFPLAPQLDGRIMESKIGRPLVSVAGNVIRFGLQGSPQSDSTSKT
jgi:uncharacterized membrane protein required for colicin V production